jgi:signal peptidase I
MNWKPVPWIAAVLNLLAAPLGMLYVQRPWMALAYFLAGGLVGVMAFLSMWIFGSAAASIALYMAGWAIAICCAVHAFRIARGIAAVPHRRWYARWYGLAGLPVALFLVALVLRSFLYEPFRIPSESMYPTVPAGSIVFVKKAGFGNYGTYGITLWAGHSTESIARGDIVVHRLVTDPSTNYLSRIVAMPGDHVQYVHRQLIVNDQSVPVRIVREDDTYQYALEQLDGRDVTIAFMPDRPSHDFDQVVPPGKYVVFGDSRDNARDSRFIGLIPRQNIVGRVAKILSPRQ